VQVVAIDVFNATVMAGRNPAAMTDAEILMLKVLLESAPAHYSEYDVVFGGG
jgi:hypothetical protein